MSTSHNTRPQFTSPDLGAFAVEDVIVKSGVFKLSDPRTKETIYVKYTSEYEVDMTSKAVRFPLSPRSQIVFPEVIDPAQLSTLNPEARSQITENFREMQWRTGLDKNHVLITRALPSKAKLLPSNGQGTIALIEELRGVPISRQEWRQFYYDLGALNKADIRHNDILDNTHPTRDERGKLSWNVFDFGKSDISNCDDRDSVLWSGALILTKDVLDARAAEWSRAQRDKYRDEHHAQFILSIHKKIATNGGTGDIRRTSLNTIMGEIPHLPRAERGDAYRFVQQNAPEGSQLWKLSSEALRKPWFRHSLNVADAPSQPQDMNYSGQALATCAA